MARVSTIKRKKGTVFKAEVRLAGHPYLCRTFSRKSEAQKWAEDTEAKLRAGGFVGDAPPGDMLLKKALDRYELEVSSQKRPNTRAREKTSAKALRKSFGQFRLAEVTTAIVASFRDERAKSVGP